MLKKTNIKKKLTNNKKRTNDKKKWSITIIVIICFLLLFFIFNLIDYPILLNVKYSASVKGTTQIYLDNGDGFSEENSQFTPIKKGLAKVTISESDFKKLQQLRIDFPENDKTKIEFHSFSVTICGFEWYEYTAKRLFVPSLLKNDIKVDQYKESRVKLKITGEDPYILIDKSIVDDLNKHISTSIFVISMFCSFSICFLVYSLVLLIWKNYRSIIQWVQSCSFDGSKRMILIRYFLISFFMILGYFCYFLYRFFIEEFNNISLGEIIFHLKVPMDGTSDSIIVEGLKFIQMPAIIGGIVFVLLLALIILKKPLRNNKITIATLGGATGMLWILTVVFVIRDFDVIGYIQLYSQKSTFIEEEYKDPGNTTVTFPEKKRNLIYIYLESMESTFASREDGGTMDENLIPELTELAQENVNFSEDELVGGSYSTEGTTWTIGAMTAQSSGIPLLLPIDGNAYDSFASFLPGAVTIGEILQKQGYNQELMVGSDIAFGGRKLFFTQHGNYDLWDYNTAIEKGKINAGYFRWWGYEDKKLYRYAKEEILRLAKEDEPFNFTMLTVDTHHVSGYVCDICPDDSKEQYENVFRCASNQVYQFISWLRKQEFYENTTIVITGDHPTMAQKYIEDYYDESKPRRVYNCFINSVAESDNTKNRKFTTMDLFPTTLAAMGVNIDGDKLGLGTNLFSGEQTLAEIYGYEELDLELSKRSVFYNKNILGE